MTKNLHELLEQRKQEVKHRTDRSLAPFGAPQLSSAPIRFEVSEKAQAIPYGGIALINQIAHQSGLVDALNTVQVLKLKAPYFESDHITNIAYNFLCGGTALEHIEYRRQDPTYLNMLGTHSIPDPTTAADFCRRFSATGIDLLQDEINKARLNIWRRQPKSFFEEAVVDLDGVLAPTDGECKQGMDISYNGQWGYHPLIVSLANTKEILFAKNRSGNRPSYEDAHIYIDKTIKLLREAGFQTIRFRGDTDFTQTKHLDRWDEAGVFFTFGIDARQNLIDIAESLEDAEWERLERSPKYEVKTIPLGKRENVKEKIVEARGYRNLTLEYEDVAMVNYRPVACERSYRLTILRKTITVKKGQELLLPETRYFFYLTNDCDASATEIVFDANARCNQENLLAQLKSGMNALSMPLDTLNANWMYLVCGCLAWSLKSWLALWLVVDGRKPAERSQKERLLKMEFRTFLQAMIFIPAQILRSGGQRIVRLLNLNAWSSTFFRLVEQVRPQPHCRRE
jgi:hypothetical protein